MTIIVEAVAVRDLTLDTPNCEIHACETPRGEAGFSLLEAIEQCANFYSSEV